MENVIPDFMGQKNAHILNKMLSLRCFENNVKWICESWCGSESDSEDEELAGFSDEDQEDEKSSIKIEKENRQLKEVVKQLRKENVEMRSGIDSLKKQKDLVKQDSLTKNIVIQGVPTEFISDNKKITENVLKIANRLYVNLSEEDINCYKIGKEANKQIKVAFSNIDINNSIYGD
ncbi:hypothetical protein HHI36_007746 [Cryptolaemus montrouzieri]|uniref:Uncharacterized protein n=1 Tax=Cryptolaemus montrouzieri TaxID=559131 RepID=A0ABD2MR12_9CUCU